MLCNFRCTSSIAGLKEQSATNEIVKRLIQDYDKFFLEEGETSPYDQTFTQVSYSEITHLISV